MILGDVSNDGEPEAGPSGFPAPGPVDPVEPFKDPFEFRSRNADPVVLHGDGDTVLDQFDTQRDPLIGFGVTHAVVEQVGDCPHELAPLTVDNGIDREPDRGDLDAMTVGERPHCIDRSLYHLVDADIALLRGRLFETCEFEKIVDDVFDPFRLLLQHVGQAGPVGGILITRKRLRKKAHRPDRGFQFMGDVGDEVSADRIDATFLRDRVDDGQTACRALLDFAIGPGLGPLRGLSFG